MNDQFGPWIRKQSLGRGGFGVVWLYHNQETDEKIAIKEFQPHNTSEKIRMWWNAEVEIMGKLQHDNLIKALPVPPELTPDPANLPVLAMEFCEGGDLRKVLNLPQNCFGLPEVEVCSLATGIGSALKYLHKHRVIHRDIKPENIVLKTVNNKILYKIIDLGYAKELDINSQCFSMVGTVKYLAPELFIGQPYSKAVDYWSLGVVIYECISGSRPFLPNAPPVEWHQQVGRKSPEDIAAEYNKNSENCEVVFSKKLPPRNHLCGPLREYFERWLRLMLRWDPKARGKANCFELLEEIDNLKILFLLHVETNSLLSYCVTREQSVADMARLIYKDTGIPADSQCILTPTGFRLNASEPALYFEEPSAIAFLFRTGPMINQERKCTNLPENVNTIVKDPTVLLDLKGHRRAWAESVYWFIEENKIYNRLMQGYRAALLNLMRDNSVLLRQKSEMETEICQLKACKEFFKTSLDFDINKCRESMEESTHLLRLLESWTDLANRLDNLDDLVERGKDLGERVSRINSAVLELQKKLDNSPVKTSNLEEFEQKAREKYEEFLKSIQANHQDVVDHYSMVQLIANCFITRDKHTKFLYSHISEIRAQKNEVEPIFKDLEEYLLYIRDAKDQLTILQRQRQETIWSLIHMPLRHQEMSTGELSTMPFSTNMMSLNTNMESLQLLTDCREYSNNFNSILREVLKEQEKTMGFFSSLKGNK